MRHVPAHDGTSIAYHHTRADFGSPTFCFAHATGFCAAVWDPVVSGIQEQLPGAGVVLIDQRSHGASAQSPHPFTWHDIGRDALAVLDAVEIEGPVVGIGHSGGAAGLLLGELDRPGTFAALVGIEPIVPPPPYVRGEDPSLALIAERRRRWFTSREEARDRWHQRAPFDTWVPDALDGYLAHGLVAGRDPETSTPGVVLACDPQDEAEWFRSSVEHAAWDRLGHVRCHVAVVIGSISSTHADGWGAAITEELHDGRLVVVDGASHFVPMEHPDRIAAEAVSISRA